MAFKMDGSQLYGKLKLNRNMDDSSQPDGRAKSSTFQMDKKSPIEKGETSTVDKIKSAGKAVFSNLGKVNSVSDPLSDKIKRSYKKNKKQYREEAAKDKAGAPMKTDPTKGRSTIISPSRDRLYEGKPSVTDNTRVPKAKKVTILKPIINTRKNQGENKIGGGGKKQKTFENLKPLEYMKKPKIKLKKMRPMAKRKSSPAPKVKETDAEFEARMKKQGMTIAPSVEVKKSEKLTQRDILAKKARANYSGSPKPGMEQSVRSKSYRDADKYIKSNQAKR
tara:strand:+ start:114 stop:947 length:834 start_codon:yes stop_codon:yes gene_type:complete